MKVKIEFYATFREKYGRGIELEVSSGDLRKLLFEASKELGEGLLKDVFDEEGNFRRDVMVTVNGRNLLDMEEVPELKDGDRIAVFPPVAGGGILMAV